MLRPQRSLVLASVVATVVAWGCGGGYEATTEAVATSLQVGVTPSSVELALYVTNATPAPVAFTFPSGQRYDFEVETEGGSEVWRWSEGRSFTQAVVTDTLQPGETWRLVAQWDPGQREGSFTAVARLTSRERPVEQRVTFELP